MKVISALAHCFTAVFCEASLFHTAAYTEVCSAVYHSLLTSKNSQISKVMDIVTNLRPSRTSLELEVKLHELITLETDDTQLISLEVMKGCGQLADPVLEEKEKFLTKKTLNCSSLYLAPPM